MALQAKELPRPGLGCPAQAVCPKSFKVYLSLFLSLNRRHIFLFDAAVIVCKRRGDNYEMKEVIDLHLFKITNNPTSDKETRKVGSRQVRQSPTSS